jgi:hypothetical protein
MSADHDEGSRNRITSRPPAKVPSRLIVFRGKEGVWRLTPTPGCLEVGAELLDGWHVGRDSEGALCIIGASEERRLTADEAARAGVIRLPVVQGRPNR